MTSRIATIFRTITAGRPAPRVPEDVHFHSDDHGVFVCDYPRCDSPGLDVTRD